MDRHIGKTLVDGTAASRFERMPSPTALSNEDIRQGDDVLIADGARGREMQQKIREAQQRTRQNLDAANDALTPIDRAPQDAGREQLARAIRKGEVLLEGTPAGDEAMRILKEVRMNAAEPAQVPKFVSAKAEQTTTGFFGRVLKRFIG